jgi:hypothetical protein
MLKTKTPSPTIGAMALNPRDSTQIQAISLFDCPSFAAVNGACRISILVIKYVPEITPGWFWLLSLLCWFSAHDH